MCLIIPVEIFLLCHSWAATCGSMAEGNHEASGHVCWLGKKCVILLLRYVADHLQSSQRPCHYYYRCHWLEIQHGQHGASLMAHGVLSPNYQGTNGGHISTNSLCKEEDLAIDGYENTHSPPAPFLQRLWAGASLIFQKDNPLLVGQHAREETRVVDVEIKEVCCCALSCTDWTFVRAAEAPQCLSHCKKTCTMKRDCLSQTGGH